MSANSTAIHGQSNHVGLLGAAAVLTAVVAAGALGIVIGTGIRPLTVDAPVAGPVIDSTSMSGPRTGVQKGLGAASTISGVDGRFIAKYDAWVAAEEAARHGAAIAATKDADASIVLPSAAAYSGSSFAGQYELWVKAQAAAAGSDFPDLYQRLVAEKGAAYGGSDFAGQYEQWRAAQAAASGSDFPDYFQRMAVPAGTIDLSKFHGLNLTEPTVAPTNVETANEFAEYMEFLASRAAASNTAFPDYFERMTVNTGTYGLDGYGGSNFAGQYEQWLKAQAAANGSDFPDWFQRNQAPVAGGSGGRGARLMQ